MSNKYIMNMIGGGFQHAFSSCGWNHPKYVIWDKTHQSGDVSVHIDEAVFGTPVNKSKYNIAWFAESPFFTQCYTDRIDDIKLKEYLLDNFNLVITCDKNVSKKHSEIKYVIPTAYPWVEDRNIFPKYKNISIIASEKNSAPGHQFRHSIVNEYKNYIDVWGRGYNPIEKKNMGLNDYRFSFAVENINVDGYFTEKITDCFATGTIPIYWGDSTITEYFSGDGILWIDEELDITQLTEEFYQSKIDHIKENFLRVLDFPISEDFIYTTYIK